MILKCYHINLNFIYRKGHNTVIIFLLILIEHQHITPGIKNEWDSTSATKMKLKNLSKEQVSQMQVFVCYEKSNLS